MRLRIMKSSGVRNGAAEKLAPVLIDGNGSAHRAGAAWARPCLSWRMPDALRNVTDELFVLPASELARRIANGDVSARAVVAAHIERLRTIDPVVNAITADRFDAALAEADQVDARRAAGESLPSLAGVPFTVKEMVSVRGMPHTLGTLARRARCADADATVVQRLRAAGAIPLCTTNVPEWGFWFETDNLIYGRTRNPWDATRAAGGSSGGEAAVIAAGASPFGVGSDIGGSIRIPAAFCGVYGHKPSRGLIPLTGHYPVYAVGPEAGIEKRSPFLVIGPMARSARDLLPLLTIMAGPDGIDPNAVSGAIGDGSAVDWRRTRVLVLEHPRIRLIPSASPEVRGAVQQAARIFGDAGASLQSVEPALFRDAVELWAAALRSSGSRTIGESTGLTSMRALAVALAAHALRRPRHSMPVLLFVLGETVAGWRTRDLEAFRARLAELRRRFDDLLGDDGILLMPPHPRTAPRHNRPMLRPFDFVYTAIFNALRVPVTVAPVRRGRDGLPLGVQIAAREGADHRCIAAALLLESVLPRLS
jgi:fatty acid amide hydrolase 2